MSLVRLAILKRLTAHLEGTQLPPELDVGTDLTGKVFRGRNLLGANDKEHRPIVSIVESPNPALTDYTGSWNDVRKSEWVLLMMGLAKIDKENPADSAYAIADAITLRLGEIVGEDKMGRAINREAHMLGKLISGLEIAPPIIRQPDDKVSSSAYFYIPIRLTVVESLTRG